MACNTCSKPFTLLRKEKGCPGCGFSYCSKCLDNKIFLEKRNAEAKVCTKCKRGVNSNHGKQIEPPDAYYKRLGVMSNDNNKNQSSIKEQNIIDKEIQERLLKLKEKNVDIPSENEITKRLQNIKSEMPTTSDDDLQRRLANLRGFPVSVIQSKPVLPTPDTRTVQEQTEDLLKQYIERTKIDSKYKNEFDEIVTDIESRLQKLKGSSVGPSNVQNYPKENTPDVEDEEETAKKIVEKLKAEALLKNNENFPSTNDELPFCEICNEDAKMRCLGCKYLFCKRCFLEHKDDDDDCNRYESYTPPNVKNSNTVHTHF